MYQPSQLKTPTVLFLVALLLACFVVPQTGQAVVPPPDGGYPNFTTAEGDHALQALTLGLGNTAIGTFSMFSVTTGSFNTAVGAGSLVLNTADSNTATGAAALLFNTTGTENTANGTAALELNTTGSFNTANGDEALVCNTIGSSNTAIGAAALHSNTTGTSNIAIGVNAGDSITTANDVICIGVLGANVSNSCYIGNIFNATSSGGLGVLVNADGKLGTTTSSRRFKDDIKSMDHASEAILALKPVTFHYKKEIDPAGMSQFGLVAEDVEKVNPDLIARDKEGKPYSVRYEAVNAMLLNEFLKEHRKVEKLEATVAEQHKDFETAVAELKGQIQKVSAQLELSKAAPQTVLNRQ